MHSILAPGQISTLGCTQHQAGSISLAFFEEQTCVFWKFIETVLCTLPFAFLFLWSRSPFLCFVFVYMYFIMLIPSYLGLISSENDILGWRSSSLLIPSMPFSSWPTYILPVLIWRKLPTRKLLHLYPLSHLQGHSSHMSSFFLKSCTSQVSSSLNQSSSQSCSSSCWPRAGLMEVASWSGLCSKEFFRYSWYWKTKRKTLPHMLSQEAIVCTLWKHRSKTRKALTYIRGAPTRERVKPSPGWCERAQKMVVVQQAQRATSPYRTRWQKGAGGRSPWIRKKLVGFLC